MMTRWIVSICSPVMPELYVWSPRILQDYMKHVCHLEDIYNKGVHMHVGTSGLSVTWIDYSWHVKAFRGFVFSLHRQHDTLWLLLTFQWTKKKVLCASSVRSNTELGDYTSLALQSAIDWPCQKWTHIHSSHSLGPKRTVDFLAS